MEKRLKGLLEKYWEGESTLEEEEEIKLLLSKGVGYQQEKAFFLGLGELKKMGTRVSSDISPEKEYPKPSKRISPYMASWMKMAAVFLLLLCGGVIYQQHQNRKLEAEQAMAYAQVMDAFSLINKNLQKGEAELGVLKDLKYLGTPHLIFNLNEMENEK
ncbi:MAG: hypothetical protein WD431_27015 [Cyclobacteriaceae bacterium]